MKGISVLALIGILVTAGMCPAFEAPGVGEQIVARRAIAAQKAAAAKAKAQDAQNAALEAQQKEIRERVERIKAELGPGWYETKMSLEKETFTIFSSPAVSSILTIIAGGVHTQKEFLDKRSTTEGLLIRLPGSTVDVEGGTGKIIAGSKTWTLDQFTILNYEATKDTDGLSKSITFGSEAVTYEVSNKSGSFTAKFNKTEPRKSRIIDANLPINLQRDLSALFSVSKINLSEKMLMGMLEGYYINQMQARGISVQDMLKNLLIDVDARSDFMTYSQRIAGLEAKKTR
jgi:hypothetical protein